jgi:hypothetical protein
MDDGILRNILRQVPSFGTGVRFTEEEEALPPDGDLLMQSPRLQGSSTAGGMAFPLTGISVESPARLDPYLEDPQGFQDFAITSGLQQQNSEAFRPTVAVDDLRTDIEGTEPSFPEFNVGFMSTSMSRQAFDLDYDSSLR